LSTIRDGKLMLYIVIMGRVCSTYGRDKNAYKLSVGNPDRKRLEGYIKRDFEEVIVRVWIKYIGRMY
jgi:hypothetical protein